ncbi:MAG: S8 family serine peptidase [Rhodospirillales bacterium]|nr:S8 family serine peptidase [Rhodospirillales bacterium]
MALAAIVTDAHAQNAPAAPIIVYTGAAEGTGAPAAALVARANERGVLRVIVGIRETLANEESLAPAQAKAQRARLRASQQAVLEATAGAGVTGVTLFDTIPFAALNADAATVQRLLADPRVTSVQEDVPVPPSLLQSVPLIKADQAAAAGFSGTGQVVAILDTGVSKTHPMFAGGKIASEACYSSTVPNHSKSLCPGGAASSTAVGSGVNCAVGINGCYHGTHVASIAVGSTASRKGVARGARAIAIQVFSRFDKLSDCFFGPTPCVRTYTSDYVKGLERVSRCAPRSRSPLST